MDSTSFDITEVIEIKGSAETVFDALVHRFSAGAFGSERASMPMKLELWPGGRWYRDLGEGRGHLWSHVQSIKRGELLEFYGPLSMSFPVSNNVIVRFKEEDGITTITFKHTAFGLIPPDLVSDMKEGWREYLEVVKEDCE